MNMVQISIGQIHKTSLIQSFIQYTVGVTLVVLHYTFKFTTGKHSNYKSIILFLQHIVS